MIEFHMQIELIRYFCSFLSLLKKEQIRPSTEEKRAKELHDKEKEEEKNKKSVKLKSFIIIIVVHV